MNILHINKYHHFKGGADVMYLKTAKLMEEHGHNSIFFSMHHPDNLECKTSKYFLPYVDLTAEHNFINRLIIAGRILYYNKARKLLSGLLNEYQVDLAHIHNIYHQISPSILYELKKRNIPVVMTLHDLKMVCASYLLYCNNTPCESCAGGKYFMVARMRCVKKSFVKSLLASFEMYFHHKLLDVYNMVDMFIVPGEFHKKKLFEMGFIRKTVYIPNFFDIKKVNETKIPDNAESDEISFVYIGRLSYEKGLLTLIDAAKKIYDTDKRIQIRVIGDGPLKNMLHEKIREEKIDNVRLLGYLKQKEVYSEIKKSVAVILPSECYENSPLAVLEAFALARPLIGANRGGIPELLSSGERGLTFDPGNIDDLCEKILYFAHNPDQSKIMGQRARSFVESELNAKKHYESLMGVYSNAIKAAGNA